MTTETTAVRAVFVESTDETDLCVLYGGQLQEQGVYLQLDEDGTYTIDVDAGAGGGVPESVYYGRDVRWYLYTAPTVTAANELLADERLAALLSEYRRDRSDGNAHAIERFLDRYAFSALVESWDAAEWLDSVSDEIRERIGTDGSEKAAAWVRENFGTNGANVVQIRGLDEYIEALSE